VPTLIEACLHSLSVALNIRNPEAHRLAAEVASLAGETKTDAVIRALQERLLRLQRERQQAVNRPASLVNRLDRIALRCASRPMADPRSADAILGYDTLGLPS
jgi:antitoxin VapB